MKANWKNDGFHKYSDEYGSVVPDCSERWTLQPAGGIIHQLRGGHLIRAKKEGKKREKERGRRAAWFGEERNNDIQLVEGLERGKERHYLKH